MARRSNSSRIERNMKERNRRMHMKDHLRRLACVIPPQTSKLSVLEILNKATNYIKQLKENKERLKRRKAQLKGEETTCNTSTDNMTVIPELRTIMNIKHFDDSTLEVNLISGLDKNFMLYEIISVLEEEAAQVIHASQIRADDKFIFIIRSKAISTRVGFETSRIDEKLRELVL
ncbi:hypothetical protein Patl1_30090 [Pistacia atlantica]|uniref:Uncharacterized protein n=1 Tax=Pistacia atlantica TaxID=434234 RepID=A0ACC1A8D8_9ROSI|nr:hypothetical protein Patl1_30090 [Pistacia atlantica]